MYLEGKKYISVLQDIAKNKGNTVYSMRAIDNNEKRISFDIWGGTDPQYYTIELLADHIVAAWDLFGKKAWYLEHYRHTRKIPK